MSRTDTLLKVKEAEAQAKSIIEKAEEEKKTLIASARRDSVKRIQDAEVQMRVASEERTSQERQKLAVQRDALLKEGTENASKLESAAAKKLVKAKDFLKKEFERTIDATS